MDNIFSPALLSAPDLSILAVGRREDETYTARNGEYMGFHLMLSTKGHGVLEINGKTHPLGENTVFWIRRGEKHIYYPASSQWHTKWIIYRDRQNTLTPLLSKITFPLMLTGDTYETYFQAITREAINNSAA